MNAALNPDAEFAYGSGHINPKKAVDPGLVYEANELDYTKFLCLEGYTTKRIKKFTENNNINCKTIWKEGYDLNSPTIAWPTLRQKTNKFKSYRTVTNVGSPNSTYKAIVMGSSSHHFTITVYPNVLQFNTLGETKDFKVRISKPSRESNCECRVDMG